MNSMVFNIQADILGVKRFKGTIDGNNIDQCKVLVATPLDTSNGNSLGFTISEYRFGLSDQFNLFTGLSFPFKADLKIELTTSGKTQRLNLLDFKSLKDK